MLRVLGALEQEEALEGFVDPETLNGDNQYFCDKCGKKCDAHKVTNVVMVNSL